MGNGCVGGEVRRGGFKGGRMPREGCPIGRQGGATGKPPACNRTVCPPASRRNTCGEEGGIQLRRHKKKVTLRKTSGSVSPSEQNDQTRGRREVASKTAPRNTLRNLGTKGLRRLLHSLFTAIKPCLGLENGTHRRAE